MITLTTNIPCVGKPSAEWVKIRTTFECYPEDALFWVQDDNKAYICMLDGNMTVCNINADIEELKQFIAVLAPKSIFSDAQTIFALGKTNAQKVFVVSRKADIAGEVRSEIANSKEIYGLLNTEGLQLPEYEYFAVDFCRRVNHGFAKYFCLKDVCAAVILLTNGYALLNGIASHKKGYGTVCLNEALKLAFGRTVLACCRENVLEFYKKNGFGVLYQAAYWVSE